jgi:hypothetical protein
MVHGGQSVQEGRYGGDTEIDTLEQQQTEKTETEMKDVNRIPIRKVYACCPGCILGGYKSTPVSHKHPPPPLSAPH